MWVKIFFALSLLSVCAARIRPLGMRTAIFLDVPQNSIKNGDVVIVEGRFPQRIAQLRFISTPTACRGGVALGSGRPFQCHPLVVRFKPKNNRIELFYKGEVGNQTDILILNLTNPAVAPGRPYRLLIKVGANNYTLILNGDVVATVSDRIGHRDIIKLRAYGGWYNEYFLQSKDKSHKTCGTRPGKSGPSLRITGGSKARTGEFPWQASIRRKHTNSFDNYKHVCGASLIERCWILTAAHCTIDIVDDPESFLIRVGDFNNRDNKTSYINEDQQDLEIAKVYNHGGFTGYPSPRDDIALVRLNSSTGCAALSDLVQPICLPTANESFPVNASCEISGWGARHFYERPPSFPEILRKGNVRIKDHDWCLEAYGKDETKAFRVGNKTVCAADQGVDSCQGDSGGPLACRRSQSSFVLWGVTSWGDRCGDEKKPGIYTKVIDYLPWIKNIMSRHDDNHLA